MGGMHESTFKSLQELFTVQGLTQTEAPEQTIAPQTQPMPKEETLRVLVSEARTALEKLYNALAAFSPSSVTKSPTASTSVPIAIEGVFDGREMIADDGVHFAVPENYASKSKLLEGDMLQCMCENGRNYFKQLQRVARITVTARLLRIDTECGVAENAAGATYKILHAPLRFFRVTPGDTLTLEIPECGGMWAAVVGKKETCYSNQALYARTLSNA